MTPARDNVFYGRGNLIPGTQGLILTTAAVVSYATTRLERSLSGLPVDDCFLSPPAGITPIAMSADVHFADVLDYSICIVTDIYTTHVSFITQELNAVMTQLQSHV